MSFSDLAFKFRHGARGHGLSSFGVALDIREVSNDDVARMLYGCAYNTGSAKQTPFDCVIDHEDRKRAMGEFEG